MKRSEPMYFDVRVLGRRVFWRVLVRSRWFSYSVGVVVVGGVLALGAQSSPGGAVARFPEDGRTHLAVLDVGQGDAILIRTASGDDVLIDGGPDDRVVEKIAAYLPAGDSDLELVVLTHPHADHLVGLLSIFQKFDVRRVLQSGAAHDTAGYDAFVDAVAAEGAQVETAREGLDVVFGDTIFAVLASGVDTGDLNDTSVVTRLTYASSTVLLMGDATERIEKTLLAASTTLRSDVLKVGHHGSKYSTSREFLRAVAPRYALVSVGRGNRYGHPSERTLKRLRDAGVEIFRTDEQSDILVDLGGEAVVVRPLGHRDRRRPGLSFEKICAILSALCPVVKIQK